jgi:hypothetical protein
MPNRASQAPLVPTPSGPPKRPLAGTHGDCAHSSPPNYGVPPHTPLTCTFLRYGDTQPSPPKRQEVVPAFNVSTEPAPVLWRADSVSAGLRHSALRYPLRPPNMATQCHQQAGRLTPVPVHTAEIGRATAAEPTATPQPKSSPSARAAVGGEGVAAHVWWSPAPSRRRSLPTRWWYRTSASPVPRLPGPRVRARRLHLRAGRPGHREDPGHRGRGRCRGRAPARTSHRPRRGEPGAPHSSPQASPPNTDA